MLVIVGPEFKSAYAPPNVKGAYILMVVSIKYAF